MQRLLLVGLFCLSMPLFAQDLQALRGGWIADVDETRHIFYIVLRDGKVSGTYCVDCADPANLAFIDDGAVTADGLRFALYRYPRNAPAFVEQVEASLQDGVLHLTIRGPDGAVRERDFHRTPQEERVLLPMPDATPNTQVGPGLANRERVLPGTAEAITVDSVAGLWLWGTGPGKQHFIFREHKGGLRGMVCGPCDSAPDIAPLERIEMNGTTLRFDIVHEDNGAALAEHGPHSNVATARISEHEMHLNVVPSFEGADFKPIEMTLLGPVRE